jgi:hypothetical protein
MYMKTRISILFHIHIGYFIQTSFAVPICFSNKLITIHLIIRLLHLDGLNITATEEMDSKNA